MRFVVFIFLFFGCTTLKTQTRNPSQKTLKLYGKAMDQINNGLLKDAIESLQATLTSDPNYIEAYLSLAGIYGEKKDYKNAVINYKTAMQKDSSYAAYYRLPYSINLAGLGNFNEALYQVNEFLSIPSLNERSIRSGLYRKKSYEFAVDYSNKHANANYNFNPINLGDSINTAQSEYYPTLSISDTLLVFSRMYRSGENFVKSVSKNNVFQKAEIVEGSINNTALKGAATVSTDGEWLIFAADYGNNGFGNFDLYISYITPDGWSEPENLGSNINTPYWESGPSISPDSRNLYFTSDRPGGFGGRDLYMSTRMSNGKWGPAVNMGEAINTSGNDLYPYIHADNQTLFFTSDGLAGYGKTDLFITRKIADDKWSTPENLGFPINTIEDEGSITISSDGSTAYYASDRADSRGGLDIYKFELRDDIKPFKTLFVKGIVSDALTNKGIPCSVELVDNATNKTIMKITADELGKYFIPLPTGKDYTFVVNRRGYLFYSNLYELSKQKPDSTYINNIALQPLQKNINTTLKNVQFATNSFTLKPISIVELDKLLQILTENSNLKLLIKGHTDNIGKAEDNLLLSTNRAKSVVDYLVSKGVVSTRLTYKGFGDTKPIAENTFEEGRAKNRRTEFEIIEL